VVKRAMRAVRSLREVLDVARTAQRVREVAVPVVVAVAVREEGGRRGCLRRRNRWRRKRGLEVVGGRR
jgi:hypothetical protein